ncbi:hypothetical protein RED65_14972 [Oceanobacter sp. RED65]|uniref:Uncharacterized protein n=2 Tax=Bermanella marisrubri TaxID=207949 RepID=Q1N456_9GAMM|nr:hypothetical protein RED65_14972 [Oceanobacter sp. RED65] [Bermanella marisrubri]
MEKKGKIKEQLALHIVELNEIIRDLKGYLDNREVPAKLKSLLASYDKDYLEFRKQIDAKVTFENLQPRAKAILDRIFAISIVLSDSFYSDDDGVRFVCDQLKNGVEQAKLLLSDGVVTFNYTGSDKDKANLSQLRARREHLASDDSKDKNLKSDYDVLLKELELAQEVHSKKEAELRRKLEEVELKLDGLSDKTSRTIQDVDQQFVEAEESLNQKQARVDSLIETMSETIVAGNYEESASVEKKSADWLRTTSLIFMVVIAVVTAYSLYETTLDSFKWENSIFRLVFIVLVSVPAAYLARESDKHRKLMNKYLQISLDLKAMDPFMSSLPIEEQHRLKSEVALRIFGTKSNEVATDQYPISVHDILTKLIERIDLKASAKEVKDSNRHEH